MEIFVETERLIIRELLPTDDSGMFELDSDPEVNLYVGRKPVKTIEESRGIIEFVRAQYIENGIGRWAVIEKKTNQFIGWLGFKLIKDTINQHSNFYDFGYRFMKKYWGKGYATEASKAVLEYGFLKLKFKEVYGMTDVHNLASRKVLEKVGFKYIGQFNYDGEPTLWREAGEVATWYKMDNPN